MDGPRNYNAKGSQPCNETPTLYAFNNMWNLKKGHNDLLCRTESDSDFEKLMVSKGDSFGGWGDALGMSGRNPIKLDCDYHCTTINVINSLSNKKIYTWGENFFKKGQHKKKRKCQLYFQ